MAVAPSSPAQLPLLVVVGPTASGKTALSVDLAERLGGEIVSADSVQIYRHFDIGTGKPSADEQARAVHHLVSIAEPDEAFDAARWAELADGIIADIVARGRTPIVSGGSFLWVRALLFGLAEAPPASPEIRARHRERAAAEGRAALHAELRRLDPTIAERLAPNDLVRVSRALEVHELSGIPLSQWHAAHGFRAPRFDAHLIGVERSREELDRRIRVRVEDMLERGLLDEVRSLDARGYAGSRAMASVGYKQAFEAVKGGQAVDHDVLIDAIVRATRVFARRQRTWLREQSVRWVSGADEVPTPTRSLS